MILINNETHNYTYDSSINDRIIKEVIVYYENEAEIYTETLHYEYQKSYVLDEHRILKEIVSGSDLYMLKYLYDENNLIIGFEYTKNNITQNINI